MFSERVISKALGILNRRYLATRPCTLAALPGPTPGHGYVLYAHVPFCNSHCVFCHYPVLLGPQLEQKSKYIRAFLKETDLWRSRLGVERVKARSVLVGGGTPTFLTLDQLRRFLDGFCERVDLSLCRQFNYDVDPNTLIGPEGSQRLAMLREYGVDRLTIGVQSLDPLILKKMGRHHGVEEALEAIHDSLAAGFQVNIEFIFGYPGQTVDTWLDMVERACHLGVHEIQLYRLKIEAYGDHQGAVTLLNLEWTQYFLIRRKMTTS